MVYAVHSLVKTSIILSCKTFITSLFDIQTRNLISIYLQFCYARPTLQAIRQLNN